LSAWAAVSAAPMASVPRTAARATLCISSSDLIRMGSIQRAGQHQNVFIDKNQENLCVLYAMFTNQ
jgi:hypothetical protein